MRTLPLAGSEQVLGVVGPPPSSAPIFMLQRLGLGIGRALRATPWENPQAGERGSVHGRQPRAGGEEPVHPRRTGSCRAVNGTTSPRAASEMLVDLRGDALDVSHYCLRHRNRMGHHGVLLNY